MPSITEWITAMASVVMAIMILLGKFPIPLPKVGPQINDNRLQTLSAEVTEIHKKVQSQATRITTLEE